MNVQCTCAPPTHTQVKAIFGTGKKKVAGCYVESGKLAKGAMIEVVRGSGKDKAVVFTGKLASLRRIKDTVDEVRGTAWCLAILHAAVQYLAVVRWSGVWCCCLGLPQPTAAAPSALQPPKTHQPTHALTCSPQLLQPPLPPPLPPPTPQVMGGLECGVAAQSA
jgi:hypothetical protein